MGFAAEVDESVVRHLPHIVTGAGTGMQPEVAPFQDRGDISRVVGTRNGARRASCRTENCVW